MDDSEKKKFHTQMFELKLQILMDQKAGKDVTHLKKQYEELKHYLARLRFEEKCAKEQEENRKGRLK